MLKGSVAKKKTGNSFSSKKIAVQVNESQKLVWSMVSVVIANLIKSINKKPVQQFQEIYSYFLLK